jgi:hypothetical protein
MELPAIIGVKQYSIGRTRLAFATRIPGLQGETPRHAGAGWGTLRVFSLCSIFRSDEPPAERWIHARSPQSPLYFLAKRGGSWPIEISGLRSGKRFFGESGIAHWEAARSEDRLAVDGLMR